MNTLSRKEMVKNEASPSRCPYCREKIWAISELSLVCSGCCTRHHAQCWQENSGCAVFGCRLTGKVARVPEFSLLQDGWFHFRRPVWLRKAIRMLLPLAIFGAVTLCIVGLVVRTGWHDLHYVNPGPKSTIIVNTDVAPIS